jgi:hypothetical protein
MNENEVSEIYALALVGVQAVEEDVQPLFQKILSISEPHMNKGQAKEIYESIISRPEDN